MKYSITILLIIISLKGLTQKVLPTFSQPTSVIISEISKEWKKDSIGKNGLRGRAFERLRYSKIDSISKEVLFKMLGTPHHTSKFYSGITRKNYVGYRYYVTCENDYPKEEFYIGSYIEFVFDENENTFLEIIDGLYCG